MLKRLLRSMAVPVLFPLVAAASLPAPATAAEMQGKHARDMNRAAGEQRAAPGCTSSGMVDKKVHSPTGVYGGASTYCTRPFPNTTLIVEVTLYRDGVQVAFDRGECYPRPTGGGCYAGTAVVSNPAGVQRWCAAAHSGGLGVPEWSKTYCATY